MDSMKKGLVVAAAVVLMLSLASGVFAQYKASAPAAPAEQPRVVREAEAVVTATVRAKPGEMPGGMAARQVSMTATIVAIDKQKSTITLKGPEGKVNTVKVQDPANLDKVKVGDDLMITYTEALAISVEHVKK
jgi:hypothetical protein